METLTPDKNNHPPRTGEYALASGAAAVERLFVLHSIYSPAGRRLLLQAGLKPGMHVADFGCGVGAVTRMIGEMVGPTGSVTGVDVSAEQTQQASVICKQAGLRNVKFHTADACDTGLPRHSFDLVYCRFLLLHLPDPAACLREMHDLKDRMAAEGRARVTRGSGRLARIAAAIIGFPRAAENVPVRVDFKLQNGRERWTRTFAGCTFHSTQEQGRGRDAWLLCERFGPVKVAMALVLDGSRLRLIVRRWSVFGIPLPVWLAPRGNSYEYSENGRFHFHVETAHPFTGLIVGYRGWLVPRDCASQGSVPSTSP